MKLVETHSVKDVTARIRIQEYGPLVFKTLPTRSSVKKAIKNELIYIDGVVATTADWIENGQLLQVYQKERTTKVFSLNMQVLYEDDHIAVINKPSGYPTSGNYFKTIENALHYNLSTSSQIDALPRLLPVHRLDNLTSGLLIIAKTKTAQIHLNTQFEQKTILKEYNAILEKRVQDILITKEIDGKTSVTTLKLIRAFDKGGQVYSLVRLFPKTGRTHQLRIHCSFIEAPIFGDALYGTKAKEGLMLHASTISFIHPETQENVKFEAPFPNRFKNFISPS